MKLNIEIIGISIFISDILIFHQRNYSYACSLAFIFYYGSAFQTGNTTIQCKSNINLLSVTIKYKMLKKYKLASDIKSIMLTRFLFGHYDDITSRKYLCKCYCIIVYFCLFIVQFKYADFVYIFMWLEYSMYFFSSLFFKSMRVSYFYKFLPAVDSLTYSKEIYLNIKKTYFSVIFCVVLFFLCIPLVDVFIPSRAHFGKTVVERVLVDFCILAVIIFRRLKFILVVSLLFYRLRVIRVTLQKRGFENTPQNRFTPMSYIRMYSAVLDWYEKSNAPFKFTVSSRFLIRLDKKIFFVIN